MDASEPSTNGISACNLYRLSSLFNDSSYETLAAETVASFESEILQYPWLFASFMPAVVAGKFGVRGVVVAGAGEEGGIWKIKEFEKQPRGGLGSFIKLGTGESWLRQRNSLLKDFGMDAKQIRVLICEEGGCREEGVNGGAAPGLADLSDITNSLAATTADSKEMLDTESTQKEAKAEQNTAPVVHNEVAGP